MNEFIGGKVAMLLTATVAAEQIIRVTESTTNADPMMFHGLLSVLLFYASLGGAAIGVFFKHRQVAQDLGIPSGETAVGRIVSIFLKIGGLGASVLCFAIAAAALMQGVIDLATPGEKIRTTPGWAGLTILVGISIGALLPKIQTGMERIIDTVVSRAEGIIGGGQ